jgi:hypothetical protein
VSASQHLNAQKIPPPRGDMGIGLCYNCVQMLAAGRLGRMPGFGQTMAPIPVPLPNGAIMAVAVPACWDCLSGAAETAQKPTLLVANGAIR